MGYVFNLIYWMVTVVVLTLMLFYVPVFTLIMLGIVLVIGITGGVLMWKYRDKK